MPSSLIIADDTLLRQMAGDILKAEGLSVSFAVGGEEGWRAFCADPADVVLLDLVLPDVHGLELLESHQKLQQMQAALLEREKAAALGLLGAGVAHEINNPLGFVRPNLAGTSGLGLSAARSQARSWGGDLQVAQKKEGLCRRLRLRAVLQPSPKAHAAGKEHERTNSP